jgi:hypothetical protein
MIDMRSLLILGLLFFVLSPGVLLTIPPCAKGLFVSGQTSLLAAAVHALLFGIILSYLFSSDVQGFQNNTNPCHQQPDGYVCVNNISYICDKQQISWVGDYCQ